MKSIYLPTYIYILMLGVLVISGTTSGIGEALLTYQNLDQYTVITLNRKVITQGDYSIQMDFSNENSIIKGILELQRILKLLKKRIDVLFLNAGMKATRKKREWCGKEVNMCKIVNLLANKYLVNNLLSNDMLSEELRLMMTTSILHFTASPDPRSADVSMTYANTKLGLFYLGQDWLKENKKWSIFMINPGLVRTNIFRDSGSCIEKIRSNFAITPKLVSNYLYICLKVNLHPGKMRYVTVSKDSRLINNIGYYLPSSKPLQDVVQKWYLGETLNFSESSWKVKDNVMRDNYLAWIKM